MSQPATSSEPHAFHPTILREYDIRGVVDDTLYSQDAFVIGQAFATIARERLNSNMPVVAVGRDGRLSSPELSAALIDGLIAGGAHVKDIGIGPTPMLYFATHHLKTDGGIMVTGSHNPPSHNGFKMVMGGKAFFSDDIRLLAQRVETNTLDHAEGKHEQLRVFDAYVNALLTPLENVNVPMHITWDSGNGATGEVVEALTKNLTSMTHTLLYTEIDGHFPNHHPDPSLPENLQDVKQAVLQNGAQLGLAFDGDGDRLGAIDDKGRLISPDHLLMLFAEQILHKHPGTTMIADVKTSQSVFDFIAQKGGTPLMWKTGHSHIKTKMKEIDASFAGEASGHIFFADDYYGFDDGLYAAIRLIRLICESNRPLSERIDQLSTAFTTPEIRIDCPDEKKFSIIEELQDDLRKRGMTFNDIDGVRASTEDGWWLLRASNTQPALVARCEASSKDALDNLTTMLEELITPHGLTLGL